MASLTILHLIACIVVFVGILVMAPKFTPEQGFVYKAHYGITWVVFLIAVGLAIVAAVMTSFQDTFILEVVSYALLIIGMVLAAPRVFFKKEASRLGAIAWYFFTAGFILGLIGVFLSMSSNSILHTITYGLIIIGLLILLPKFFQSGRNILGWIIIIAGLVLEILSIRF